MPDPKQALPQGDPHSAGFFTRLAQLFKRGEIPANVARPTARPVGDDEEDGACPVDGDSAAMATWLGDKLSMPSDRARQLSIWEEMDATGLVSSLLDVYAAESAAQDYDRGASVWIESAAPHIIQAGKECLANVQMEDRIVPLTRRMCKQGDAFQRLIYSTGKGVLGWRHAPTEKVTRYEDKYQRLVGFKQTGQVYRGNLKREVSWPWDYVHFRLLGKDEESGYGTSLLSNMFRDWRAMMLINDAALLYRLRRGVDRNMVMVDIQNMEEHEAIDYVNRFKKALRKQEFIDPASPNYRKSYNPLTPMEDIFIPIRGSDSQTRVETLSAAGNIGEMFDLEHVTNSFFGSAGAPKAYFGFEGDVNAKCLALSTQIPCLDGVTRTLQQIIDLHKAGKPLPFAYSFDKLSKTIVPGRITWAGVTRRDAEVLEVELDDGTVHRCTPDHVWFLLDGSEVQAHTLKAGDQLVPLRRSKAVKYGGRKGYEKLYDPYGGCAWTHQRVAHEYWAGDLQECIQPNVHHVDHNKSNNDPRNLSVLEFSEHLDSHTTSRFGHLTTFRKTNGPWNKGITKSSSDVRSLYLRQTTMVHKKCPVCGYEWDVPRMLKHRKFCSSACAGRHGSKARVEKGSVKKTCQNCGKCMQTTMSRIKEGKANCCSRKCASESATKNRTKVCAYCSKSFDPGTKKDQLFCSRSCTMFARNKTKQGKIPLPNHQVIAVRKVKARIDTGDISVEHFHNFFIADRGTGGVLVHNSTLTQLSVQFARNCKRIQRAVKYGIRTLTDIHFTLLRTAESGGKYDVSKSDNEYLVQMSPISYLDEWERLELVQLRYQIVSEMAGMSQTMGIDPRVWSTYVLLNYAKIPEDLVLKLVSKMPEGGAPAPTTDVQGEGSHFHGLSSERRAEILDNLNESRKGFYQLTEDEKKQIAVAIHRSPKLRQIISHFAELYEDDKVAQQIDPSRLPPFVNGNVFEDSFAEDVNAKTLMEDLAAATGKKLKD
jgi:hypothetical protein